MCGGGGGGGGEVQGAEGWGMLKLCGFCLFHDAKQKKECQARGV